MARDTWPVLNFSSFVFLHSVAILKNLSQSFINRFQSLSYCCHQIQVNTAQKYSRYNLYILRGIAFLIIDLWLSSSIAWASPGYCFWPIGCIFVMLYTRAISNFSPKTKTESWQLKKGQKENLKGRIYRRNFCYWRRDRIKKGNNNNEIPGVIYAPTPRDLCIYSERLRTRIQKYNTERRPIQVLKLHVYSDELIRRLCKTGKPSRGRTGMILVKTAD